MKINKRIMVIVIVAISFLISVALSLVLPSDILIVEDEFSITFLGVILGIEITILTFIYSSLSTIQSFIDKLYGKKDIEKSTKVNNLLLSAFNELIEDVKFVFIAYLLLIVFIIIFNIDFPYIHWPFKILSKDCVNIILKVWIMINILVATIDSFFTLTNIMKLATFRKK
ncbi:hypothetical protein [Ructibacterium gallinarum]|uniref:Uncharacterized protein n=1 Tax=Ructibacterium gallinarum TaxID=2779355 RepID=A0A9D5M3V7_9FIRM|nr:hypothetical protein [Ructibacterium gallinarum]MBE5040130.1 hypothetical protein [Ructibacterium gallinarum]